MHRRVFSLSAASLATAAAFGSVAISTAANAQAKAFKDGTDYLTLEKPAPTDVGPGQIEVVEFFWYSCPHCNSFEPQLDVWAKKLPKDVIVKRMPVSFRPDFEPQQRLYFVLEAMGKVDELHKKVFYAIHTDKLSLNKPDSVADWAAKQGINRAKFVEMYNSFSVTNKIRKATQLQDSYKVDGVPALGVAGRYFTSGSLAQSMDRALVVADYLIGLSRGAK